MTTSSAFLWRTRLGLGCTTGNPCVPLQGCGIVWPTTIGKLELNICKVLKAESFDRLTSQGFGLQVGFCPAI